MTQPKDESGTTALVALLFKQHLHTAHVGDSRAVLCSNGQGADYSCRHSLSNFQAFWTQASLLLHCSWYTQVLDYFLNQETLYLVVKLQMLGQIE